MTVLLSFLFWFIGLVVGGFGLIQVLICIRTGSAFTNRLLANGIITPASAKKIKSSYLPTIFFWSIIFLAATVCVFYFCEVVNKREPGPPRKQEDSPWSRKCGYTGLIT